jgi:hypothetical protein
LQELQQPLNPSNLPCGFTVVGITIEPLTDENVIGEDHTVTATLTDLLDNPQPGILVTFEVVSGPNAGASGTCSPNADCTTAASGQVSFTYSGTGGVGTDEIVACFINEAMEEICSQVATKDWVQPPNADLKIVSQGTLAANCVDPAPADIGVSSDAQICVKKVLHNNGPWGPVEVELGWTDLVGPVDCGSWVKDRPTQIELPVSVDVAVDALYGIHCERASLHTFTAQTNINRIKDPDVVDPDPKIVGHELVERPETMIVGEEVDVTLRKTLHNSGPYGPAQGAAIAATPIMPPDCSTTPKDVPSSVDLPVSTEVVVDEVWTIHCSAAGNRVFRLENSILLPAHVEDTDPGNNSASSAFAVIVAQVRCPPWDRDCDGCYNYYEMALGSDPDDKDSTPKNIAIPATCQDGLDNDKDGLTDTADPSCP